MFRVCGINNFGPGDKELQKWCLANSIPPKEIFLQNLEFYEMDCMNIFFSFPIAIISYFCPETMCSKNTRAISWQFTILFLVQ